jgi:5-carboxymethyl-2-hydroxymuconate isomerase
MPHIILNAAVSVLPSDKAEYLLETLCSSLATIDSFNRSEIKARLLHNMATSCGSSLCADAHVHIALHVMPGRSDALLSSAIDLLLDLTSQVVTSETEITAEVTFINKPFYRKRLPVTSGAGLVPS